MKDEAAMLQAIACVQWLGRYVGSCSLSANTEDSTDLVNERAGLFRVPPSDAMLSALKESMAKCAVSEEENADVLKEGEKKLSEEYYIRRSRPYLVTLRTILHERREAGVVECANGVASLLKWYLRELDSRLLPFDFVIEDLSRFKLTNIEAEKRKCEVGASLAQDIVHTMVSTNAELSDDYLGLALALSGMLLSLLCSISRAPIFHMDAYALTVPFLPSLSGGPRLADVDLSQVLKEHAAMKTLNDRRRAVEATNEAAGIDSPHEQLPQSRLEVLVLYGHRIWGGIQAALPSIGVAAQTLREHDAANANECKDPTAASFRRRKRDVLKKVLNPNRWFAKKEIGAPAAAAAAAPAAMVATPPPVLGLGENSSADGPVATGTSQWEPIPYTSTNTEMFRKDPKLDGLGMGRVQSVRLQSRTTSSSSSGNSASPKHQRQLSQEQAAEIGKTLFRRATSNESSHERGIDVETSTLPSLLPAPVATPVIDVSTINDVNYN